MVPQEALGIPLKSSHVLVEVNMTWDRPSVKSTVFWHLMIYLHNLQKGCGKE